MATINQQSPETTNAATVATDPTASAEQDQALKMQAGFRRVERLIRAVPRSELQAVNLDVPITVATVIGAYDEIKQCRPELAVLPMLDITDVDNLRDYALALGHTHVANRATAGTQDPIGAIAERVVGIRDQFLADGTSLAKRGLLPQELIDKHRGGTSYRMIAFDVLGLVQVFQVHWEKIGPKSPLTTEELATAETIANELVAAVGRKEQAPDSTSESSLLREQAYTLLVRAYGEVRDALSYVRRKSGDVDSIAPSLWANRGKRATEAAPAPAPPPASPLASLIAPQEGNKVPVGYPGSEPLSD